MPSRREEVPQKNINQLENQTKQKTVSFHTLGCRLNFSETGSLTQGFSQRNYKIVPFGQNSDITLINTCTVTDGADSTCRQLIRQAHRANPEGKIVVVGCYAQMAPEEIAAIQGVDLILGTSEKYKVFDYLDHEEEQLTRIDKSNEFWGAATTKEDEGHTRAFLKIQDGCNYICSFCIIPFARGRSRCIGVTEAVETAKKILTEGHREIVLTGVNIGEYVGPKGESLTQLVESILSIDGLERLRLSSVEPNTLNEELLKLCQQSPAFQDHFHIPLQSGDDKILVDMKRKYDTARYREIVSMVKDYFPQASIGADIMAGFPGETRAEFENTLQFLTEAPVTHFHVFPYSKRQLTVAAKREDHVLDREKKSRVKELISLGDKKWGDFASKSLGQRCRVLVERKNKNGLYTGYTGHYLPVLVDSNQNLKNQICEVELVDLVDKKVIARLID